MAGQPLLEAMSNPFYKEYSDFLAEHFDCKVQKISINAGNN